MMKKPVVLKNSTFLPLLVLFVLAFGSQQMLGWPLVRVWGYSSWGSGISGDLQSVLTAADCFKKAPIGAFLETGAGSCLFIYGNFLILTLNFLGLGSSSTLFLSWLFIVGISLAFAWVTHLSFIPIKSTWARIAIISALASPPIALLLERANFDALVFVVSFAGLLLLRNQKIVVSAALIGAAALMKFYAILGFAIFAARRMKKLQGALVLSIFFGSIVEIALELFVRKPSIPMDIGGAFGSYSLGLWFNFSTAYMQIPASLSNAASLTIGLLTLAAGVLCTFLFLRRTGATTSLIFDISGRSKLDFFGAGMAPIYLGCYILGMNFDYRLVFFIPFALAVVAKSTSRKTLVSYLALFLGAMWFSYNSGIFGQVAGDLVMGIWASLAVISIVLTSTAALPIAIRTRLPLVMQNLYTKTSR
jgi:hypothetical protein